jgi:O-antigen/teichoic acid export membrane protein
MRIFQNFGYLSAGKLLGDFFTFLLFVVLSRVFGQEGLGQYSFAMAIGGFLLVLSDFGLYSYSIKEMSRLESGVGAYYGRILSLRLLLAAAVLFLVGAALPWLPISLELKLIILLLGVQQVLYSLVDGFSGVFVAREEMHLAALVEFTLRAVGALAAIAVVYLGGSLVLALAALPAAALLQVLAAYWVVRRRYGPTRLDFRLRREAEILREALPFGLSRLLGQVATRMDVLLLGILLGAAATGVYNAAYRIVFLLMFISYFASMALFPTASRLFTSSIKELTSFYRLSLSLLVLAALPISAGIWLIAPDLVGLIYGAEFAESAGVLRFLAWLIFLTFLNNSLGMFLTAADRQAERTRVQWTAAWVNGLGNLLLISLLGLYGAALATLFSEGLLTLLLLLRLKEVLGPPGLTSRLLIGSAAAAAFCVPFFIFDAVPIYIVIPASMLLYLGVVASFKEIRNYEGRFLKKIFLHRNTVESQP